MSLTDLITLLQAHNWLGLIALLTLLARKWTSADSKFPVTIPPTWQPTVTAAGGLIYGLVSGWSQGPESAVLSMLITAGTGGFFDGVLTAVFDHDNAPVWARSLVFVFDDLTGKGPPPTGAAKERIARLSTRPPPAPPATPRAFLLPAVFVAVLCSFGVGVTARTTTTGCTPAQQAMFGKIENLVLAGIEAGKTRQQIEADVATLLVGKDGAAIAVIVDDAITMLLDAGGIRVEFVPPAKRLLAMHQVAK